MLYTKAALFWVYLWQLKEYRLDRFLSEYGFFGKLLCFWLFSGGRKFHRPVFTIKALVIYFISLILALIGIDFVLRFFLYGEYYSAWFLILGLAAIYFLIPFVVMIIMWFLQVPIVLAKNLIYKMAATRVAANKNLIVIGITGSYGKSSTKEFLAQILERKFKVRKTPKNINTEIGIAKFILQKLNVDDEIFIVEMGAYKKGEIKRVCDIVRPKMGIITGINEQHLSLFGSFQDIIETKRELAESLPEDGFALFNGENKYCVEMAEKWQGEKIAYSAENLTPTLSLERRGSIPSFYLQNLAGAIEAAKYLGMSEEDINKAVAVIQLTDRMAHTFIGKNGVLVIEDTYSANPAGVMAALDYLGQQTRKYKIVVMPCLIELGEAGERIHCSIGKKIKEVCDLAIITTHDFFHEIKAEAGDKVVLAIKPENVIELLKDKLNSDAAVLLEGRLADSIVNFVK